MKSSRPFRKLSTLNSTFVTRGFTLVEMLVSIAVFMVVMTVAVGSLVSVVDANRKAQAVKSVMNNLSFALESMSKTIRVGRNYDAEGNRFTFLYPGDFNQDGVLSNEAEGGDSITYAFNDTNDDGTGVITRSVGTDAPVPITAPEVRVAKLGFFTDPDGLRTLISIDGVAGTREKSKTNFSIQTTVTKIGF